MEAGTYGRRSLAPSRRLTTETKQAFKTTEFWVYVALLLGLLIAGLVADGGGDAGTTTEADGFGADKVWLYATILTVGYLISRGLAKAGSYDPYTEQHNTGGGSDLTERVRTAAQVIKDGPEAAHGTDHQTESPTRRL